MYLRRHQYYYYLKTDIVRFFPNVDHAVMLKTLQNRIVERGGPDALGPRVELQADCPSAPHVAGNRLAARP